MTTLQIVLSIVLILISLVLLVVILMQKSREADASAVQGGSSSDFFDKTAGHQKDDTLANITKVLGVTFFVVALATTLVLLFL